MPRHTPKILLLLCAAALFHASAQAQETPKPAPARPAINASIPSGKIVVIGHRKALQAKASAPKGAAPAPVAAATPAAAATTPCRG